MRSAEAPLTGLRVLVSRPEPRASELSAFLSGKGAQVRALPMIEIRPLAETPERRALIQNFDQFQRVVVVSPIAADFLLQQLDHWWPQLPVGQHWYGVGQGTARALSRAGIDCRAPARGHDSEHLLELPELVRLEYEKVLICGGEGGRPLLTEALRQRGAQVTKLALYQRQPPEYPLALLEDALARFAPHAIVALSAETLNNLLSLGQNADRELRKRVVVVPTERVAAQAREWGFDQPRIASSLDPAGIAAALEPLADSLAAASSGAGRP